MIVIFVFLFQITKDNIVKTGKENAISENYTGIYGYFDGSYLDGTGWIPEDSYNPKTRPWYTAALKAKGDTALVTPYIDAETHTLMMTVSKLFSDGEYDLN